MVEPQLSYKHNCKDTGKTTVRTLKRLCNTLLALLLALNLQLCFCKSRWHRIAVIVCSDSNFINRQCPQELAIGLLNDNKLNLKEAIH